MKQFLGSDSDHAEGKKLRHQQGVQTAFPTHSVASESSQTPGRYRCECLHSRLHFDLKAPISLSYATSDMFASLSTAWALSA